MIIMSETKKENNQVMDQLTDEELEMINGGSVVTYKKCPMCGTAFDLEYNYDGGYYKTIVVEALCGKCSDRLV